MRGQKKRPRYRATATGHLDSLDVYWHIATVSRPANPLRWTVLDFGHKVYDSGEVPLRHRTRGLWMRPKIQQNGGHRFRDSML
jgi:hypothetical protein